MYDLFRMESVYTSHATPYGNFGLLLTGFYSDEVERTELDRVGGLWNPRFESARWAQRLHLAGDFVQPNDGSARLHTGLEVEIERRFVLRGGYRANYDTWGQTYGAGFRTELLAVDYAYQVNDNDFDPTHRISLRFSFPHTP
jgi:hypothetical protein